jgi:hypothetical protein
MATLKEIMNKRFSNKKNAYQYDKDYVQGLRDMANFLEKNPCCIPQSDGVGVHTFFSDAEEIEMVAGAQKWEEDSSDSFFALRKNFGPHQVSINTNRENVCEKVEVGTESVEIRNPDAPKITVVRPIYEWKCQGSDLGVDA